jgi:hypothetical protein
MIFKYFCYDQGNVEVNPDVSVILILFLCFREGICKNVLQVSMATANTIDVVTSLFLYLLDQMSVGKMVFYQNRFTFVLLFQQNDFKIFLL